MHNRWCLSQGPIHRRHVVHVKIGRHDDRGSLGLELTWRHGILRLRRLVRVPLLLHLLHVLGVTVRRSILLLMIGVVGSIGIVMDRRVALRRQRVVLLLSLSPPRYKWAWHHEPRARMLPLQSVAGQRPSGQRARQREESSEGRSATVSAWGGTAGEAGGDGLLSGGSRVEKYCWGPAERESRDRRWTGCGETR